MAEARAPTTRSPRKATRCSGSSIRGTPENRSPRCGSAWSFVCTSCRSSTRDDVGSRRGRWRLGRTHTGANDWPQNRGCLIFGGTSIRQRRQVVHAPSTGICGQSRRESSRGYARWARRMRCGLFGCRRRSTASPISRGRGTLRLWRGSRGRARPSRTHRFAAVDTNWTVILPETLRDRSRRDGTVDVSHQRVPALVLVGSQMARGTSCRLDVSAGALSVSSDSGGQGFESPQLHRKCWSEAVFRSPEAAFVLPRRAAWGDIGGPAGGPRRGVKPLLR